MCGGRVERGNQGMTRSGGVQVKREGKVSRIVGASLRGCRESDYEIVGRSDRVCVVTTTHRQSPEQERGTGRRSGWRWKRGPSWTACRRLQICTSECVGPRFAITRKTFPAKPFRLHWKRSFLPFRPSTSFAHSATRIVAARVDSRIHFTMLAGLR